MFLDKFAADIANQALKNQSSEGLGDRELWSANDVLLIAYPDNLNSQSTSPLQCLQKFLGEHLSETISIVHVLPFSLLLATMDFQSKIILKLIKNLGIGVTSTTSPNIQP